MTGISSLFTKSSSTSSEEMSKSLLGSSRRRIEGSFKRFSKSKNLILSPPLKSLSLIFASKNLA